MRQQVFKCVAEDRVIAILRGIHGQAAFEAARALAEGGIRLVEVTLSGGLAADEDPAPRTIELLRERLEGRICVGAGTVLERKQAELAARAGASFILSPDTRADVIARTRELDMVSIPGAATPTELLTASRCGADFVKIFPAAALGEAYFEALRGPVGHIGLIAVGGIGCGNAARFLAAGAAAVGVGSGLSVGGHTSEIRSNARELVRAAGRKTGSI